jgi:leader peptidase (prepilin peptidase)/N-methyltransferase
MLAMIGAFLGLEGSVLTMMVGAICGAVSGVIYVRVARRDMSTYELPFGSFLGFAALAVMFLGDPALRG